MRKIKVDLKERSYDVVVGRNILDKSGEIFNLNRKVFILTDDGVPEAYAEKIRSSCKESIICVISQGERSKNIETFVAVLEEMVKFGLTRTDAIVGVGGGVVGDLTRFLASTYMRGIDFYNVPTTLLSMVDSSVGGKTGIDFCGIKNSVGTFYQPKGVLASVETLNSLPDRQFSNGLAESIKMSATLDSELFEMLEVCDFKTEIEEIVYRSVLIKKNVIEKDEKESGLRKVLNFGHTLAHAIESANDMQNFYHGEAVAIGMMKMASGKALERLDKVLQKANLPTTFNGDKLKTANFIKHDKKCSGDFIDVIKTDEIGTFKMEKISVSELVDQII